MTSVGYAVFVLMVIPACFHPSYDHPTCGPKGECPSGLTCNAQGSCEDANPDASVPDIPGGCTTFASQVDTCRLAFNGDLTLSGSIAYDTGTHELKVNGTVMPVAHMTLTAKAGDVDAIFAHNVRFISGAGLHAIGTLPFAIVASGSVTLEDASQIDVGNGGAGALPVCSTPPKPGGNDTGGAGGGGGGGYGGGGGDGGPGNLDGTLAPGGTRSFSMGMPRGPRGGCPGASGGAGDSPGGLGGLGGGALYIVAADRIDLGNGAALTACGGGGHGGSQGGGLSGDAGGGGGGSGGMIVLEAPHVIGLQARVAANGGGGGEGSSSSVPGHDGNAGLSSGSRAAGGTGGPTDGVDGGRGGSLEESTGETVTARLNSGGGGGGGGVGYVHIVSADVHLEVISPPAQ